MLVAAPAMAHDPLDDIQGTESWLTPGKSPRRPVETQRSILLQAELEQTSADFQADRAWMEQQQAEQAADGKALKDYRASRQTSQSPTWLSSEERRLEDAAARALGNDPSKPEAPAPREPQTSAADAAFENAAHAAPTSRESARAAPAVAPAAATPAAASSAPAAAADSAFDAPRTRRTASPPPAQPRRQTASEPPPATSEATRGSPRTDATAGDETAIEDEAAASRDVQRAADRAASEKRKRESESAKRLGGHLDASGQFVDPDLESP